MFDAEAQELEANEALEREMRRNLLGKLEGCSRLHQARSRLDCARRVQQSQAYLLSTFSALLLLRQFPN